MEGCTWRGSFSMTNQTHIRLQELSVDITLLAWTGRTLTAHIYSFNLQRQVSNVLTHHHLRNKKWDTRHLLLRSGANGGGVFFWREPERFLHSSAGEPIGESVEIEWNNIQIATRRGELKRHFSIRQFFGVSFVPAEFSNEAELSVTKW